MVSLKLSSSSRTKELIATLGKLPIRVCLLLELRLDRWVCFVARQTFELASVLKGFGKSLHGRACRPWESRHKEAYALNRFGKTVKSGRVQTDRPASSAMTKASGT